MQSAQSTPAGIPGVELTGPWPVGRYAVRLRAWLRERARVQLFGEVWGWRVHRTRVYFELRDADGAVPCAIWLNDLERLGLAEGALADGVRVVVAGGPDYYPGSRTSSPGFSFAVSALRLAGEGVFAQQKALLRPALPRSIGVVTGEGGKARDDVLAGLARRGWAGRLVWAFAPVQDRHAAPAITSALGDLAAVAEVEIVIVARGGGSLADLLCFCDETLCRTVALLGVPVIASVGHHTDRTLLDDVAAVSCSTPTHAAEAAVPVDCSRARGEQAAVAARLRDHGRRAVLSRARMLAALARAPDSHVHKQRSRLHQHVRELRAIGRRRVEVERALAGRRALVLERKRDSTLLDCRTRAPRELQRLALALAAHDPERTLARGYAVVETPQGDPLMRAAQARAAEDVRLRF